jgi:hypothetical protein
MLLLMGSDIRKGRRGDREALHEAPLFLPFCFWGTCRGGRCGCLLGPVSGSLSTLFSGNAPRAVLRLAQTWIDQLSLTTARAWRSGNRWTLLLLLRPRLGKGRCGFHCPALRSFGDSQRATWAPELDGQATAARFQRPNVAACVSRKRRVAPSSATAVSLPEAWAVVSTQMLWRLFTGLFMLACPCTSTVRLTRVAG